MRIKKFLRDMSRAGTYGFGANVPRTYGQEMIDRYGTVMAKAHEESGDAFEARKIAEREYMNARYGAFRPYPYERKLTDQIDMTVDNPAPGAVYAGGAPVIETEPDPVEAILADAADAPTHRVLIIRVDVGETITPAYSASQARMIFERETKTPFIYAAIRKL